MNEEQSIDSDSLYLKQLEFKPKDALTWLSFFIRNFRVTVLIVIGLMTWGIYSFFQLPLESNPEVEIPFGIVSVVLPGSSPADVEELVVKKVESKVANLSGVKQVSSTALNSFATVSVEFLPTEDLKDAIRRLRDAVADVEQELPAEAGDPVVSEVSFSDAPVWTVVVTGPYDNFALRGYAERVQDELKKLPGTSDVLISGGDVEEIRITYDPQKLQLYGMTVDQVNGSIRANNTALPLGTIDVSKFEYTVRIDGKLSDVSDVRSLPVGYVNNRLLRLQDVAIVALRAQERKAFTKFSIKGAEPKNAVTLNIIKKTGSSIIDLIDDGKERIVELQRTEFPQDLAVETTLDISQIIRRDFDQLIHDGILTIIFVTLIVFLFVGLKEAFVAGLAVPLVFAATFGIMRALGITLNFLSLFSLILSLGLLVDDAIVVVQATKQYLKTGKFTPEEAVLLVFHDYKILLTTTTLTTIWAFIPLLLATGIIGQFIRSIPITVSVTLASSYVIAIIINHPMAIILERFRLVRAHAKLLIAATGITFLVSIAFIVRQPASFLVLVMMLVSGALFGTLLLLYRRTLRERLMRNEQLMLEERADPEKIKQKVHHHYRASNKERSFFSRITTGVFKLDGVLIRYNTTMIRILKSKKKSFLILGIVALLFLGSALLPAVGILKFAFLQPADAENMYINIEGPPGLLTSETGEIAKQVENVLRNEQTIYTFSETIGSGGVNTSGENQGFLSVGGGQTNKAQFAINLYPYKGRPAGENGRVEKSYDIAPRIREQVASITGATIEVVELAGGPPAGADFEARISGEDLAVLEQEINRFKTILEDIPGTINEKTSLVLSPGEFTFTLDESAMQIHGVTAAYVGSVLRTALSGSEVTTILHEGDELDVRAEFDPRAVSNIDAIKSLVLLSPRGEQFQLGDIADVKLGSSLTSISRIDEKRVIVLTASVQKPFLPNEVQVQFQEKINSAPLPNGYEMAFGGLNETNTESIISILQAMIAAMFLIIGTLVIQFNSFRKAVLVLATIPLAMTGVFYGFTAVGYILTFPALIGILALFGVVVKNAVIMVDKINLNLRVGIAYIPAIADAAKSRLEAIVLTSLSTIIGMIPITVSNETWNGLGMALIFGLSTSTFLTLFVIPILYKLLVEKAHRKEERLRELMNLQGQRTV